MRNGKEWGLEAREGGFHIRGGANTGTAAERWARVLFTACAWTVILAVASITLYMIANGLPAFFKIGWKELLFGRVWAPTAAEPKFGILYVILASLAGTALAVLLGVPVGILTAVYLAESGRPGAELVRQAVELLACIPSVIFGLLGVHLLSPLIYKLELRIFAGSDTHRFTGGANLLSASLVLAVMILPTVIHMSEAAIRAVAPDIREASLALGASGVQTIFQVVLPAARPGIAAGAALGVGRAAGEAMAITLVSGGSVNMPLPFESVRFLTTAIVGEMGYAQGVHRQVLFSIGLVLYLFIMAVNITLNRAVKEGK